MSRWQELFIFAFFLLSVAALSFFVAKTLAEADSQVPGILIQQQMVVIEIQGDGVIVEGNTGNRFKLQNAQGLEVGDTVTIWH